MSGRSAKELIGEAGDRPFSPALGAGPLVFVSGQVSVDRTSGAVVGTDVASQTTQVLDNLRDVLAGAGLDLDDLVKTTVFLTDIKDFGAMNEVYRARFAPPRPTRSTVEVSALARPEFKVEIEGIALRREH